MFRLQVQDVSPIPVSPSKSVDTSNVCEYNPGYHYSKIVIPSIHLLRLTIDFSSPPIVRSGAVRQICHLFYLQDFHSLLYGGISMYASDLNAGLVLAYTVGKTGPGPLSTACEMSTFTFSYYIQTMLICWRCFFNFLLLTLMRRLNFPHWGSFLSFYWSPVIPMPNIFCFSPTWVLTGSRCTLGHTSLLASNWSLIV